MDIYKLVSDFTERVIQQKKEEGQYMPVAAALGVLEHRLSAALEMMTPELRAEYIRKFLGERIVAYATIPPRDKTSPQNCYHIVTIDVLSTDATKKPALGGFCF
jgi:hypothetical protein